MTQIGVFFPGSVKAAVALNFHDVPHDVTLSIIDSPYAAIEVSEMDTHTHTQTTRKSFISCQKHSTSG